MQGGEKRWDGEVCGCREGGRGGMVRCVGAGRRGGMVRCVGAGRRGRGGMTLSRGEVRRWRPLVTMFTQV